MKRRCFTQKPISLSFPARGATFPSHHVPTCYDDYCITQPKKRLHFHVLAIQKNARFAFGCDLIKHNLPSAVSPRTETKPPSSNTESIPRAPHHLDQYTL